MNKYFILTLIIISLNCKAQTYQGQQTKILAYNLVSSVIITTIGCIINKDEDVRTIDAVKRGLAYGSTGGVLLFLGKKTTQAIVRKENLLYAWPAKIIHSAGVSCIESGSLYKHQLNTHFGFARFEYDGEFRAKVMPVSFVGFVVSITQAKFQLKETFMTGIMQFKTDKLLHPKYGLMYGAIGVTNNNITMSDYTRSYYETMSHEIIHTFQYIENIPINTYLDRHKNLKSKYVYYDTPYNTLFYNIEYWVSKGSYAANYYEMEAMSFSKMKYVPTKIN